jgi:2,3,4,5-tetrahydropyridine-2-carboxylate N-succinyltransferase
LGKQSFVTRRDNNKAHREVIELLDAGKLRVAEPKGDAWQVNEWVKKSSCYVFSYPENGNRSWNFEYHDKMELKKTMLLKEFV